MPASSAAASIDRPSSASRAKGFSHSTCLPAAMAARAMGAWVRGGVAMVTASTSCKGEGVVHRGEGPGDAEQAGALRPSWPGRGRPGPSPRSRQPGAPARG